MSSSTGTGPAAKPKRLRGELLVSNLRKEYAPRKKGGAVSVGLANASFEVSSGELVTLVGPSGCGKTTTLRCIAGLERPTRGSITVGGSVVYSSDRALFVEPNKRGLGMVFQSYAIWPHLNVYENVAFPLNVARGPERLDKSRIRQLVQGVLDVVQLDGLEARKATDLSGGQQQRLALARALVANPPLLLLDEPLSNLDAKLRESMRLEFKRLQRELGLTALYVTHDQTEALAISNRVVVMSDGLIEQVGRPRDIYERPASKFVADFIGSSNLVDATVVGVEGSDSHDGEGVHRYRVRSILGICTAECTVAGLSPGDALVLSVRPEDVHLSEAGPDSSTTGPRGVVEVRGFIGEAVEHLIRVAKDSIRVRAPKSISIDSGRAVSLTLTARDYWAVAPEQAANRAVAL